MELKEILTRNVAGKIGGDLRAAFFMVVFSYGIIGLYDSNAFSLGELDPRTS